MTWSITVSGADEAGLEESVVALAASAFVHDLLATRNVTVTEASVYLGTEGARRDLLPSRATEPLATGPGPVATEPTPEAAPPVDPATQTAIDAGAPVPPPPSAEG